MAFHGEPVCCVDRRVTRMQGYGMCAVCDAFGNERNSSSPASGLVAYGMEDREWVLHIQRYTESGLTSLISPARLVIFRCIVALA
jgi:hypothetical protein